mmetsp:Transcript_18299/g.42361  ORF Transcript_18299/g.42361 Transcript_18299/m.42361 type:complete len:111 (+) Transcript_18299:1106-1438(+)
MDAESQEQLEAGDIDSAIGTLSSALVIRRLRLTKRQKQAKQEQAPEQRLKEKDEVARTLGDYARMLAKKGERKQAGMLYKEAIRVYGSNGHKDSHPSIHNLSVELEQLCE